MIRIFHINATLANKIGQPPGTLSTSGLNRDELPEIRLLSYGDGQISERQLSLAELSDCRQQDRVNWIHVSGAQHLPAIEAIGKVFMLHSLVLEDILTLGQRPKLEDYGDYSFFVLTVLSVNEGVISNEQISIVLGSDYVLTFQQQQSTLFMPIRNRLLNTKDRINRLGADYLTYSLLDVAVDHFFGVLENVGEQIEVLEQEVVTQPQPILLHRIHELKTQMLLVRKAVWPLRELLAVIERGQATLFCESTLVYIRDAYDHTSQVLENLEVYREMLTGLLDVYLSSQSNKLNEIIKILTIISTMFMPLTFIVGLYGMNFKYMPELEWQWGYPAVMALMVVLTGVMFWFFRQRRWI